MSDFWKSLSLNSERTGSTIDTFLSDAVETRMHGRSMNGPEVTSLQALTDKEITKYAGLRVPVLTGTRVKLVRKLQAALTYDQIPRDGVAGTVVTVKTAQGTANMVDDRVFVKFDDGTFGSYHTAHLKETVSSKTASTVVMASMDLDDFLMGKEANELIHKSSKDLWSFSKGAEGYRLERLFDDTGSPIKE